MNWEQLLSLKRYGDSHKRLRKEQDETRLGFEVDYDRIIFSSEFRSLQDKTQVVPLSKTDFVHTRLTHSLEVSVVGRSLGRQVGQQVLKKYPQLRDSLGYQINDFGAIVAAASLAHDIGNPPFGHSGENAIGSFFASDKGIPFKTKMNPSEYQDLCDFEGNANGFKILTESKIGKAGGLRLSYASLGAFMKYPKGSLPKKPTTHIADKKFGYFQSEKTHFIDLAEELGLLKRDKDGTRCCRHPLAYLVEAADDICYTIIDFEDGINLGLIAEDYALEYLMSLVKKTINTKKYYTLNSTKERVSYLRALAINSLIQESVEIFISQEESILQGNFNQSLLDLSQHKAQIEDIIKLSVKNIYQSKEVIEKELLGYQVLHNLLDTLTEVAFHSYENNLKTYHQLVLTHLSEDLDFKNESVYDNLMQVCLFVSKLSDSKAIQLSRVIGGLIV